MGGDERKGGKRERTEREEKGRREIEWKGRAEKHPPSIPAYASELRRRKTWFYFRSRSVDLKVEV